MNAFRIGERVEFDPLPKLPGNGDWVAEGVRRPGRGIATQRCTALANKEIEGWQFNRKI